MTRRALSGSRHDRNPRHCHARTLVWYAESDRHQDGRDIGFADLSRLDRAVALVRCTQIERKLPCAAIRDNTVAAHMLPFDLLHAKLPFFGVNHFDPRSDCWLRINMYRAAPVPRELGQDDAGDWARPAVGTRALALKAARGAGLNWGLSEEADDAVRYCDARGLGDADAGGIPDMATEGSRRRRERLNNSDRPRYY